MKIAIIGPGAMGRLLGWFLSQGGHIPLFICRREKQADYFNEHGILFVDQQGAEHHVPAEATHQPETVQFDDVAGAIVTVKSYDTRSAGDVLRLLPAHIPVLSLQNGLGNAQALSECVSPERLSIGLTTHGATAEGINRVLYKGQGQTIIGDLVPAGFGVPAPSAFWQDVLQQGGHPVTLTEDIETEVWRKAMINIGINPFTALFNLKNGELLEHPAILDLMKRTVEEAEAVARARGMDLSDSYARVLQVCRDTAGNRSSMLQDLINGRQTEIDSLCGIIVSSGAQSSIQTSYNTMLKELVKVAEQQKTLHQVYQILSAQRHE